MEVLSDTMYSSSPSVIDALADFIETTVQISDEKVMSQGRMNQVRHILQVDEQSFKAQFSAYQLKTIESHEMASIVDELVSAIGLQRFRFTEHQKRGTNIICPCCLNCNRSMAHTDLCALSLIRRRQCLSQSDNNCCLRLRHLARYC